MDGEIIAGEGSLSGAGAATPAGGIPAGGADPGAGGGGGQPAGAGAPPQPPGGGQPPAGAPPAEQEVEVKVDGKMERVKLSELTAGYSRHANYTRDKQALARERDSFGEERTRLVNEGVQAEINRILEGQAKGGGGEGNQPPDQMSLMQNKLQSLETRHADEALDRALVALHGQHPDLKDKGREDAFLYAAQAHGIKDLKDLDGFAKTHFEGEATRQTESVRTMFKDAENPLVKELSEAIIHKYLESKAGGAPPIPTGQPGTPPAPPQPPPAPGSYQAARAIDDAVLARLNAGGA